MSNLFGVFISYVIAFMALTGQMLKKSTQGQEIMDRIRPFYGVTSLMLFLMYVMYLYEMVLNIDLLLERLALSPLIMISIIQLVLFSTVITAIISNDFLGVYVLNRTYNTKEQAKLKWKKTQPYLKILGWLNVVFATLLLVVSWLI